MRQSRLFELLRTFSKEERLRLRLFAASPYFSRGEWAGQLSALLEFCLASLDNDSGSVPERAEAYAALFPGEASVAGKLEKRMSALYGLAQQFLITELYFLPENEPDHQMALAQELQKRGLNTRSRAALKAARQLLEHAVQHDSVYYAKQLKLAGQETTQAFITPSKSGKIPLNRNFETLFLFYHTVKQDLALSFQSLVSRYAYQPSALTLRILNEEPLPPEFLDSNPFLYFSSFYLALLNRAEPDMDNFNRFIRELRQQEGLLSTYDVQNCWTIARNLLIIWWNSSKKKEIAQLYLDISLENASRGYLSYHGKIHPYSLESVCRMALESGRFDIAYGFVREQRGKISGETEDEPYFRHNMTRYYLHTGDFEKALDELPHSIPDNSVQLNSKILEIQILYELDSELLPYRMDALRIFLNRSGPRIHSPQRLKMVRDFLNFLAQIRRCPPGNARRAETIAARIKSIPPVTEYYWLLDKVAEQGRQP